MFFVRIHRYEILNCWDSSFVIVLGTEHESRLLSYKIVHSERADHRRQNALGTSSIRQKDKHVNYCQNCQRQPPKCARYTLSILFWWPSSRAALGPLRNFHRPWQLEQVFRGFNIFILRFFSESKCQTKFGNDRVPCSFWNIIFCIKLNFTKRQVKIVIYVRIKNILSLLSGSSSYNKTSIFGPLIQSTFPFPGSKTFTHFKWNKIHKVIF